MRIAVENAGNDFIMSPEQAVEHLDTINGEWVRWPFDAANEGRIGPAERWSQVIGKRILRIHVKDDAAKPTGLATRGNACPGRRDGDPRGPAVVEALDNAGYTGWVISDRLDPQASDVESALDPALRMDRILAPCLRPAGDCSS